MRLGAWGVAGTGYRFHGFTINKKTAWLGSGLGVAVVAVVVDSTMRKSRNQYP